MLQDSGWGGVVSASSSPSNSAVRGVRSEGLMMKRAAVWRWQGRDFVRDEIEREIEGCNEEAGTDGGKMPRRYGPVVFGAGLDIDG